MRHLRKQKGYTNYEKFAFEHNISSSQYARYEMGKDIRMSTFFKLLDALGVSPQEFLGRGFEG